MAVTDWGEVFKVAAVGFGGVFTILIILFICVWITGKSVRLVKPKPDTSPKKRLS